MNTRGIAEKYPVLLGGAALTRSYVENDLSAVFKGDVRYARDAFEGLRLMDGVMSRKRGLDHGRRGRRRREGRRAQGRGTSVRCGSPSERRAADAETEAGDPGALRRRRRQPGPDPAVLGFPGGQGRRAGRLLVDARRAGDVHGAVGPARRQGRQRARATRNSWRRRAGRGCGTGWSGCTPRRCCEAAVVYGYFPCVSEGDEVVVLAEPDIDAPEVCPVHLPAAAAGPAPVPGRLLPAPLGRGGGRHRLHRGHDGPADRRFRQRAVRRQRLSRLPGGARAVGAADRGARRVLAPADPVGAGFPRRDRPRPQTTRRHREILRPGIPRRPLLVRLPGLPRPRPTRRR